MNNKALIFLVGVVSGSLLTYFATKDRFEKLLKKEIDSVKESFSSKNKKDENKTEKTEVVKEKVESTSFEEYKKRIEDLGYKKSMTQPDIQDTIQPEVDENRTWRDPYVISPDQFSEFADYECITLTYFKDGYLCDDLTNEQIFDIENTIGDGLNHFGEYDEDSVYVRNERLKVDYEILKDLRKYEDILKDNPNISNYNKLNYSGFKEE